jgi:hypothetical protein
VHCRFVSLAPGQQRNVAVYVMHLLLDSAVLLYIAKPLLELWLGWSQTAAEVATGEVAFMYLVACYTLELTWRRRIDTMLAIHHIGTIAIVVAYAGELPVRGCVPRSGRAACGASGSVAPLARDRPCGCAHAPHRRIARCPPC